MRKNLLLAGLSVLFLLPGCLSTNLFVDINQLQTDLVDIGPITPEAYPEDDAVTLLQEETVNVSLVSGGVYIRPETEVSYHVVKKIFRNLDDYADFSVRLGTNDLIKSVGARVINPDGTIVVVRDEDIIRTSYQAGVGTDKETGTRVTLKFSGLKENSIIEYFVVYTSMSFFESAVWNIQGYQPILKNEYKLIAPRIMIIPKENDGYGWTWRFKEYNYQLDSPVQTNLANPSGNMNDAKVMFAWSVKNVPAFRPDPMMPDHSMYRGYLRFADFDWSDWNVIAKEYLERYYKDRLQATDSLVKLTNKLIAGKSSDEEKIQAVYNYAQGLRYEAIPLGDRGWRPALPADVIRLGYGDCKDKSTLLITMLRELGYKAEPVLVLTMDEGRMDPSFPTRRFNHMIARVETKAGRILWLDPTLRYARLTDMRWDCEDINVLVLHDNKTATIERTPGSISQDNITTINQVVTIDNSDSLLFQVDMVYKGEQNHSRRNKFKDYSALDLEKYCKSMMGDDFLNIRLMNVSHSPLDSIHQDFSLRFSFKTSAAISRQGDLVFVHTDPFELIDKTSWLSKDKRKYPIEFAYPYILRKNITVNFPDKRYKLRTLPEAYQKSTDHLAYKKTFSQPSPGQLVSNEEFELKGIVINPRYYGDVKQFYEGTKSKMKEKVIFTYQ